MQKDFDKWNNRKKLIHMTADVIGIHEREVWWVSLGINVGVEIDGKQQTYERPVIVLRKFNNQMVWVLPITSQKKNPPFYEHFIFGDKAYFAALTQLRTISTKRFLRKIGMIPKTDFARMQERIVVFVLNKKDEDPTSGSSR